jgi:hypothetical protein
MYDVAALTARTADTLQAIRATRSRIDAMVARLCPESRTHGEFVELERTHEQFHLMILAEFGRWQRGEISAAALAFRLDQWDQAPTIQAA